MAGYFTDKRTLNYHSGRYTQKFSNQSVSTVGNFGDFTGDQTTTSYRTNRFVPLVRAGDVRDGPTPLEILEGAPLGNLGKNIGDTGHTFSTEKKRSGTTHYDYFYGKPYSNKLGDSGYRGPLWCWNFATPQYPTLPTWSVSDQNFFGSQAIRDTVPTGTSAHLAEALGQLAAGQEIPRMIGFSLIPVLQSRLSSYKALGSEYLNVQYGWLPFMKDLNELLFAVKNAQSILEQWKRDSGRIVRRSRVYPQTQTAPSLDASGVSNLQWPNNPEFFAVASGKLQVYDTLSVRYKFSGAYSYYVPDFDSEPLASFGSQANHLLGLKLTPSVLWELTPWTWLLDWMGNVGNILFNASAFSQDNLVMRWGYLQRHTIATRSHILDGIQFIGKPKLTVANTFSIDKKERIRSTPYGFGLNPATFSTRQWTILGALGLTLAPQKLR